jgi:hypothetical protein
MGIQVGQQSKVRMLAKRSSHQIYNIIPKSQKWLTLNVVVNIVGGFLSRFYIFVGERIKDNYIKDCKLRTCIVV